MGTLFLVATPIGNLEDLSARAIRILSEVDLIAAEDTRQTRKLLSHYGIHTRTISYHEHNKLIKVEPILETLQDRNVALVSDAGTPALNDPGYELVKACLEVGYQVSPIPGACAPISALVASGLPTDAFLYLGYLPRKSKARQSLLTSIQQQPYTLIFLETPHRLLSAMKDIESILGNRQIAIARELTKIHEEIFRGSVSEAIQYYTETQPRGEITLIIYGKLEKAAQWSEKQITEAIQNALEDGEQPSIIARNIAKQSGWQRSEVYQLITKIQNSKNNHIGE
jgi:16S rRNA (cytidine1402-2'-O)-methyltransferase